MTVVRPVPIRHARYPSRGDRWAVTAAAVLAGVSCLRVDSIQNYLALALFALSAVALTAILLMAGRNQDFTGMPAAQGTILAVVPTFNEATRNTWATVRAILDQTYPVAQVVVVDDGSVRPVTPFPDPRVIWVRQDNAGKRHAQVKGVTSATVTPDYILTVDSDSVIAPDGVEHLMRAMSAPNVTAATGLPILRNRTRNLITRVTDLEIAYSCFTTRAARSSIGAVLPASGALTVYRSDVITNNIRNYLHSGTYSDDRKLTHYALRIGRVVAVNAAIVETEMPSTPRGVFRQRLRWFRGATKAIPWEVRRLSGAPLAFRCWGLAMFLLWPAMVAWQLAVAPLLLGHAPSWSPVGYWLGLLYMQTSSYLRRGVRLRSRLATWIFLTPALMLFQLTLIRPALYWAAFTLRETGWGTRRAVERIDTTAPQVVAGAR